MSIQAQLIQSMIQYYSGDPMRIHHFLKVYGFAKTIGELEGLDDETQFILEIASIIHDIGIKVSEEKYGSSNGKYQEKEGPAIAKPILQSLGFSTPVIERVCYLIGHHHSYNDIDGIDFQILVEADFLVNIYEEHIAVSSIPKVEKNIFKTAAGTQFLKQTYAS
ncbi:MAG: HD domain-containing protein [Bacteroidota bacterium]|nr:HD domain-containing protein [Bacteroidota bacterium]